MNNDCEKCFYFGIPGDAGYDLPCMCFDENVVDDPGDK